MAHQRFLERALAVLVRQPQELQDVGVAHRFLRGERVPRLRDLSLRQHRRLVARQCGALVEHRPDLAVELADRPPAAERLGLVEVPRVRVLDRQEPHVVRPRERKPARGRPGGGPSNSGRFGRHCLPNRPAEVERAHQTQISFGKPTPVSGGQVVRQAGEQFIAVPGPGLSALLELDDPPPHLPVGGGDDPVDGAGRGGAGLVEQPGQAGDEPVVGHPAVGHGRGGERQWVGRGRSLLGHGTDEWLPGHRTSRRCGRQAISSAVATSRPNGALHAMTPRPAVP